MNILEQILKERKMKKISWDRLAEGLPIQGNSLRVAFERGSVDDLYIEHVKKVLNLHYISDVNDTPEAYNIEVTHIDGLRSSVMHVPLVNQYAYAGYLSGFADNEYVDTLPKIPFILDKEYRGEYLCFEVKGDSMECESEESIPEGSILLCRNVRKEYWKNKLHIHKWDFVIVHNTDGILVKRIINHDVESGIITIHSLNEFYEDRQLHLKDVQQIFNIVEVQTKRKRR